MHQLVVFSLGAEEYGLPITAVQEIIRYQEMTRVPLAPPVVRGLINLRGQIVTAIDLRRRLEMKDLPADQSEREQGTGGYISADAVHIGHPKREDVVRTPGLFT